MPARWFPPEAVVIDFEEAGFVVGVACRTERLRNVNSPFWAVGYFGKAQRPAFNFVFRDGEGLDRYVASQYARGVAMLEQRAKSQAERKAVARVLAVGDILRSSWGYDQTNIDYYEVTRLVGKRSVEIREIAQEAKEDGPLTMTGSCVPLPGRYKSDPMIKLDQGGYVRVRSFACATKIEPVAVVAGKKLYPASSWTSYA